MNERPQRYLSYLLRMWREERGGEVIWRASLESAQTGERWGFATVDGLVDFIHERTAGSTDANQKNST